MFRDLLRVNKVDGTAAGGAAQTVIQLSVPTEPQDFSQTVEWLGSFVTGCSLLYPHGRLVLDLAKVREADGELLSTIEHHRAQVEARGGSLRVELPPTRPSIF